MGLKLENVVPWGRSLQEYIRMFNLAAEEMQWMILDCAAGPASFNAEMTASGYKVISCDPVYQFTAEEIARRIQQTYEPIIEGVKANRNSYIWKEIQSPQELGQVRMKAMHHFLEDFEQGIKQGRYVPDELPALSFETGQFDIALCSHFLFTYSDQLSENFHLASIREMCRVAKEVRIFPLLDIAGAQSPLIKPVASALERQGYQVEMRQVPYEFQRGGNQMLSVSKGQ